MSGAVIAANQSLRYISSVEITGAGTTFTVPASHFFKGQISGYATAAAPGQGAWVILELKKNNNAGVVVVVAGNSASQMSPLTPEIAVSSSFEVGPGTYYLAAGSGSVGPTKLSVLGSIYTNSP